VNLTEDEIRNITLTAISELGEKATPELVKKVVSNTIEKIGEKEIIDNGKKVSSGKVILTSFGLNSTGIVASITKILSNFSCDIYDISQKIMGDFYTMIMIIDITNSNKELKELQEELNKIGEELKIKIYLQHEDVFRYMHRI